MKGIRNHVMHGHVECTRIGATLVWFVEGDLVLGPPSPYVLIDHMETL